MNEEEFRKKFMRLLNAAENRHQNPRSRPYNYDFEKGSKFLEVAKTYFDSGDSILLDFFLTNDLKLLTQIDLRKIRQSNQFNLGN